MLLKSKLNKVNLLELKNNYNHMVSYKSTKGFRPNTRHLSRITVKFIKNNLYISTMTQGFLLLDMSLGLIKNKTLALTLKRNSLKYKLLFLRYYFLVLKVMFQEYPDSFFQLWIKNSTDLTFWLVDILANEVKLDYIFFLNKNNYSKVKKKKFRSIKRKIRKKITLFE